MDNLFNSIEIALILLDADYSINKINTTLLDMFGYTEDELRDKPLNILFNQNEYKKIQANLLNSKYSQHISSIQKFELNAIRHDKTVITLEITIMQTDIEPNCKFILILRDLSEINKKLKDLQNLAYYDQLTKTPNRTLFTDRADTALRQAKRQSEKLAIVYIDVDDFKVINDTFGHESGDILLKELSKRFQKCVRDSDTVSRLGGDEFAILMLNVKCINDAAIVVERIQKSNLIPIKINGTSIIPKTSMGISIFPNDGENINILMKNSDAAMYSAKKNGKNKFVFYNSTINNKSDQ